VYPLPTQKKHIVYLITEEKIYKQELDMEKVDTYPRGKGKIIPFYQNIQNMNNISI